MSTSERLAALGYTHQPGRLSGRRTILDPSGTVVLQDVTCFECNDWLDRIEKKQ